MDSDVGARLLEGLKIGVDRHELDPGNPGVDHPVDRVDAGAPDADDANHRLVGTWRSGRRRVGTRFLAPVDRRLGIDGLVAEDPAQAILRLRNRALDAGALEP